MTGIATTKKTQVEQFRAQAETWGPELQNVCYRGFTPERVLSAALEAAVHEPKILEATKASIYRALLRTARWGLDIGDTVWLVPINKKVSKRGEPDRWVTIVEAWPDYRGLKALAMRQGIIRGAEEYVVYAGDRFEYQLGLEQYLRHQPCGDPMERGRMVGAYTIIRLPFSDRTFNYMDIADIEAIRASSKSWGPEKVPTCPAWYAKKTVIRDYLNRQPKQGAELAEALAADDTADDPEEYDPETGEVLPTPGPAGGVYAQFQKAPKAPEPTIPPAVSKERRGRANVRGEGYENVRDQPTREAEDQEIDRFLQGQDEPR